MRPNTECVDYLSYSFDELDLHSCWKKATREKHSLVNGRRLENASWRRFFQLKYKLPTVDPATLNWQKDSDATWLYGPFCPCPISELEEKKVEVIKKVKKTRRPLLKSALKKTDRGNIIENLKKPLNEKKQNEPYKITKKIGETTFFIEESRKKIRFSHYVGQRVILDAEQVELVFQELESRPPPSPTNFQTTSKLCGQSKMITRMNQDTTFLQRNSLETLLKKSYTTKPGPVTNLNDELPLEYYQAEIKEEAKGIISSAFSTVQTVKDMAKFAWLATTTSLGFF